MLNYEDIIFGTASSGVPAMVMLLTIGFIFDYFRIFLFKD